MMTDGKLEIIRNFNEGCKRLVQSESSTPDEDVEAWVRLHHSTLNIDALLKEVERLHGVLRDAGLSPTGGKRE